MVDSGWLHVSLSAIDHQLSTSRPFEAELRLF